MPASPISKSSRYDFPDGINVKLLAIFALSAFTVVAIAQVLLAPGIIRRFYPLPEDQGATWYYWQLADPTTITRLSYWIGYAAHQLVIFVLLFMGKGIRGNSGQAHRFNLLVLVSNIAFVVLHLVQTQIWYDGLAQDVPIWTSQGSVIGMLILVLFLEMPRRGLFFGRWKKAPQRLYVFIRKWHGIYISWALVYTFWFHPMEGNWGMLSGFIYMYLLFIQLSLYNTKLHTNKGWIVLMEAGVIIHGTLITVYKHNPIWPMFLFGFLIMFSVTQVYAWKSRLLRIAAFVTYVVGAVCVYGFVRGFDLLYELTFIPVALYGGAIALWAIGYVIEKLSGKSGARTLRSPVT